MPYCSRVCTGGDTTVVKGLCFRVAPLRKISRPSWRQETVQDVEKIYLLVYNGTRLLRRCLELRRIRMRKGEVEKEHEGNEAVHNEGSGGVCRDRHLRITSYNQTRKLLYPHDQRSMLKIGTDRTTQENYRCAHSARVRTSLDIRIWTPSEAAVRQWNAVHGLVLPEHLLNFGDTERLHDNVLSPGQRPS